MQREVVRGVEAENGGSHAGPGVNLMGAVVDVCEKQEVALAQACTGTAPLGIGIQLLSVQQVAQRLGVSPAWVRDHATRKQPHLKRVKVGKLLKFQPDDIDEFIKQWCQ